MMNLSVKRKDYFWLGGLTLLVVAVYLTMGGLSGGPGYPLDDAWIHQTYARNLATLHQWTYFNGNTTNGSTAPLWTLLLSVGYFLDIPYLVWSNFFGSIFLFGTGAAGLLIFKEIFSSQKKEISMVAALILVGEWHLVWASVSGMETMFYIFCVMVLFLLTLNAKPDWLGAGILIGLAIWLRPDAITLVGPAGMILLLKPHSWKVKGRQLLILMAGLLIVFLPYLGFNRLLSGSWMPNTFYAKQAEYASLLSLPWIVRFGQLAAQPLIGVGALLLPGAGYAIYLIVVNRFFSIGAWFAWWLGYTCIYATMLPVTYQHGRYLMPGMPVFLVIGLWGSFELMARYWRKRKWSIPLKSWAFSILIVWGLFLFLGAQAFAADEAIIQSEMVRTAQWISLNTAPNAVVAAHDIGALGYFGQRKIIDLAGLVTTDVIPIIRDEPGLKQYLDTHQADCLMVFPDWYSNLAVDKRILYQSRGQAVIQAGGTNMAVYDWKGGN